MFLGTYISSMYFRYFQAFQVLYSLLLPATITTSRYSHYFKVLSTSSRYSHYFQLLSTSSTYSHNILPGTEQSQTLHYDSPHFLNQRGVRLCTVSYSGESIILRTSPRKLDYLQNPFRLLIRGLGGFDS